MYYIVEVKDGEYIIESGPFIDKTRANARCLELSKMFSATFTIKEEKEL